MYMHNIIVWTLLDNFSYEFAFILIIWMQMHNLIVQQGPHVYEVSEVCQNLVTG